MSKFIYPAVFHTEEVGGYSVTFPDLPGCVTEGDTLVEALEMATDALNIYLSSLKDDNENFPPASNPTLLTTDKDDFISLIEWDERNYVPISDSTPIEKKLTIPNWLNNMATAKNINLSELFQNALMRELNVTTA